MDMAILSADPFVGSKNQFCKVCELFNMAIYNVKKESQVLRYPPGKPGGYLNHIYDLCRSTGFFRFLHRFQTRIPSLPRETPHCTAEFRRQFHILSEDG